MSMLEIENLHAGYGDFLVLTGVDIEVEEGEIVCLIGPNGAGKSTVFRCVFGMLTPTEGRITYNGEDVLGKSPDELLRMGMSYILQQDSAFKKMTIEENLEMGAYAAPRDFDLDSRLEEMYDLFPVLDERRHTKAGTLSGGESQMLEFARGLMLEPEFILLDEPTAGLAPKIIDDVFDKIAEIRERGVTICMVEQNIKTGLKYADRAYVLENGETRFSGDAATILETPEVSEAYLSENVTYEAE